MRLDDARRLALDLMREHLTVVMVHPGESPRIGGPWTFAFDRSVSRFGCCKFGKRKITLSKKLTELNDESDVRDTILHEIAHAIAGWEAHHGPKWKAVAKRIGAKPERCFSTDDVVTPPSKYVGYCAHDNCTGHLRNRLTVRARSAACGKCIRRHRVRNFWSRDDELKEMFLIKWHTNRMELAEGVRCTRKEFVTRLTYSWRV